MRKIAANYVFPIVGEPIRNGYVKFNDNNEVVEVGQLEGECADTEFYSGILCPGFINAHNHVELSHLLGAFKQATGMSGFINQINALRDTVDQEGRIKALEYQMEKMYAEGVQAMADISNDSSSLKVKKSHRMYTRTFLEVFGSEPDMCDGVMADVTALKAEADQIGIDAAPTPHSCYTMSPQLLSASAAAGLADGFLSYHSQESQEEEDLLLTGTGAMYENRKRSGMSTPPVTGESSLKYFIGRLADAKSAPYDEHILLVHNVCLSQDDIDAARKVMKNVYWAVCPLSNIFIHNALPPIPLMRKNGLSVIVGTDSLSSNDDLDIVKELYCLHANFPEVPMSQLLEWACLNGAKFLKKDDVLGSLSVGKKPGVVLISNVDAEGNLTADSCSKRIV